jgi:hypothetical protein
VLRKHPNFEENRVSHSYHFKWGKLSERRWKKKEGSKETNEGK